MITQNNKREALLNVVRSPGTHPVFTKGSRGFEMKFVRQAVKEDKNLQLITLLRTAESKSLRFGVDDAEHLAGGFPRTREELFAYSGLILGSIEAGAFTGDQLRMIAEFVERRGGGLLMVGGPRAVLPRAATPARRWRTSCRSRSIGPSAPPTGEFEVTHLAVRPTPRRRVARC